jgi:uncharacterized protein (DUF2164 family)
METETNQKFLSSQRVKEVLKKLTIEKTNQKDIDSTNIIIYFDAEEIGRGHYNNTTNFAHIELISRFENMEDDIVNYIETTELQ